MDAPVPRPQVLGAPGEPCPECGAPLAGDQRYCLECGARRADPRVDFRKYMRSQGSPPIPAAAAPAAQVPAGEEERRALRSRDHGPLAAVGGIAVLGLMLLVGVLIGKGDSPPASVSPTPQIVRVGSGSNAGDSRSAPTAAPGGQKNASEKQAHGAGTDAKAVAGGLTGSAARNSKETVQATTDDLEALQESSGEDYEETVKKLPDKIATPGAPPPIDKSKAPGAGGGAQTIE